MLRLGSRRGLARRLQSALAGRMAVGVRASAGLLLAASAAAAQEPAGTKHTRVLNRAQAVWEAAGVTRVVEDSAAVWLETFVPRMGTVHLEPPRAAVRRPGERQVFSHLLRNGQNLTDSIALSVTAPPGWSASVYVDADGDGALGPGDVPVAGLRLALGGERMLLVVVDIPAAAQPGTAGIRVVATSTTDPAASASLVDQIEVEAPQPAVVGMEKVVDRAAARVGDTLTYTLVVSNHGGPSEATTLVDSLPAALRYVPGSLRVDAVGMTDAADADIARVTRGPRDVVVVELGALTAGARREVTFRAVLASGESVANVAVILLGTQLISSPPAPTQLMTAQLALDKQVVGDTTAVVGDLLTWRIRYVNRTAGVLVRDAMLVDTLPAGTAFVSATGGGVHADGIVRWSIPFVAPFDSAEYTVVARLVDAVPGAWLRNVVTIEGTNATAAMDTTGHRVRAGGGALRLAKRAAALEAALGEQVPYTISVANRGAAPLGGIVVRDRLPEGVQLVAGSVRGADSLRQVGRDVELFVEGPLAAGETRDVWYLVTVLARPRDGVLRNVATARAGTIESADTVSATVRVRRGAPVESRTILGKVYLDLNENGRQDAGEPGVASAQVWGADGEVVISDRDGRFSFRDTRAGMHAVRLDMYGLPPELRLARGQHDVVMVRADGWTTPQVTFRLTMEPVAARPATLALAGGSTVTSAALRDAARQAAADTAQRSARDLQVGEDTSSVAPLLTAEQRAAERRRELVAGPGIEIFAPRDGAVMHLQRVFIGAKGEPGRPVWLYDGDTLVEEAKFRPDGVFDFVGTRITPGPHVFRVRTVNSWGQERWDSIRVQRPGVPDTIVVPRRAVDLRTDAEAVPLRVQVLDAWGLPVLPGTRVTVEAKGASLGGGDADRTSIGEQRAVGAGGWLELPLKGGGRVGTGTLALLAGDSVTATLGLRVLPAVRPLIVSGVGQVGVGSGEQSFGALTARGAIDEQTSVSVSIDTRRSAEGQFFAREYDALDEARYPIFGDRSDRRVIAPSRSAVSMRVERGFDWLEAGDVETTPFAREGGLLTYRRALTGAQARVTTGSVTWHGFGSMTRQALQHRQLRGDGTSGPYPLGGEVRPGTERVAVEVRAQENAARVISRRELSRLTDYEIDYFTGTILLRQPLPSTDVAGNPTFLIVESEQHGGGEARMVGGLRGEANLAPSGADGRGFLAGFDTVLVGGMFIRDEASSAAQFGTAGPRMGAGASGGIVGADARLRGRGLALDLELLRADVADSAALAGRAAARWATTDGRYSIKGSWQQVSSGFASSFDPRLVGGTSELRVAAATRFSPGSSLELGHERQRFEMYGVARASTTLRGEQLVGGRRIREELSLTEDVSRREDETRSAASLVARITAAATTRSDVWVEGSRQVAGVADVSRPSRIGGGVTYRIAKGASLEGMHQLVRSEANGASSISALRLKADGVLGTRAWGGVERAAAAHATHNAVLGLDRRFKLARVWTAAAMFERRFGLDRTPLADPSRALPFASVEQDRWSTAASIEYLPGPDKARGTLKAELQGGEARRGSRIDFSADIPFGADAALLTRHDWSSHENGAPGSESALAGAALAQRSIVGFAFRPTRSDELNVIGKVEWRRTRNPAYGGVLADSSDRRRFIGAADAIWTPRLGTEIAARYAIRYAGWSYGEAVADGSPIAHYVGAHAERALPRGIADGRISLRMETRYLFEQASGAQRWSFAPSAIVRVTDQLQVEAGWRGGALRDADFGASAGAFVNFGIRVTEHGLRSAQQFWQRRF